MAWIDDKVYELTQSPAIAAAAGSLLSLKWLPVGSTWRSKIFSLISGFCVAVYLVPWATSAADMTSEKGKLALSFLGGLLGLLILSRAWEYVAHTNFGELVSSMFRRKIP